MIDETLEGAKDLAAIAAEGLGWDPPYRWQGPNADGMHDLHASSMQPQSKHSNDEAGEEGS